MCEEPGSAHTHKEVAPKMSSSRLELPVSLADAIGEEAAQAATRLVRTLLLGRRPGSRTCECRDVPDRCEITADEDGVHVSFDPSRRCRACGLAGPSTRASAER